MSVGINAPRWRRSHVGPLFSDKHSRSCSRTRFCSTLDFLLLQLSIGSNYTEATVRSKTVKKNVRAWSAVLLVGPKPLNRLLREEQAVLQQTSSVLTPQRHFVREKAGGARCWRLEPPACVEATTGSKPSPTLVIFILEFWKHYIENAFVNI